MNAAKRYNRVRALAWVTAGVVLILLGIGGVMLATHHSAPQPSPVSSAWHGAQGIARSAAQAVSTPQGLAVWLESQAQVTGTQTVGRLTVIGSFHGRPVVCMRTSTADLTAYGVSASESVGPWLCGIVDGGVPDLALNRAFGHALGY